MPSAKRSPRWCEEPHRLLFPLGAALGVIAVLPFAVGGNTAGGELALFHSVAQIQGFLTCFVAGFLMTLVPRHTRTIPATRWEVVAAMFLPTFAVLCAWVGDSALASWLWLVLLALVLAFTLSRFRARPSSAQLAPGLLWVPVSLGAGALGAILVAGGPTLPFPYSYQAWTVGRGLLVQGFVTGLVLGISGFLLPHLTRGEPLPDLGAARSRRGVAVHASAAALFFASFPLELAIGSQLGFAVRGVVTLGVLVGEARIHRPPILPGVLRRLVWLAAWLVPAAFFLGAAALRFRGAALHVLFVGGFAQITLAVSTHLVLAREGRVAALVRSPLALRAMAVMLAAAFVARIVATVDLPHVADWLGVAAFAFCAALAAWGVVVGPALIASRPAARAGREVPSQS